MSFRIGIDETVPRAIRRLARKQLRGAVQTLGDGRQSLAERVHHMRTSAKKVRALAQLVRPRVGRPAARVERRLKKVARATSALRDDEMLLATFDALIPGLASEVGSTSLRRARVKLTARLRATIRAFEADHRLPKLAARLRRARRETKLWMLRGKDRGLPVLGLVRGYRSARRTMKQAQQEDSSSAFHRWRKAVKAHGYQLRLFALKLKLLQDTGQQSEALGRLSDLLGHEHDLTVLEQVVGTDRACFPNERDRARLLALIDDRRQTLRSEALVLGAQLFSNRPRAVRRRLREEVREGTSKRWVPSPEDLPLHPRGRARPAQRRSTESHLRAV